MQHDERVDIANRVRAELESHGVTQRAAGAILGLPWQSVQKRLSAEVAFRADELARLADELAIPVSSFFREVAAK